MTTRQGPPPKTADKTPQEVQNMAPAERDAYLQKKAEEGVEPGSWLFGPVQQWIAQAKAKNQAQEIGDKNVADATKGRDVEYVQGLQAPNADYKGSDHAQLKAYLDSNLNVQQVSDVSTAYFKVHQVFDKFAQSMNTAVNASKGTWEGSAAENAQQYFTSLGKWSDANSQNARLASETIYDQGQAAATAKNSMPDPIPFSWGDEFKSWATSNPFNLADNVDKSIQKQKDSQAAHDQAAGVMATYDKNLYEAASKQPAFAPPPSFSTGGGSGDPNGSGDKNGISNPSSVNMPGHSSVNMPGPGSVSTPGGTSGFVSGTTGNPHFSGPGSTTGSGFVPAGTTTPSSFTPSPVASGSASNPNQSFGGMPPMSPMPMGGMNFGGDEAYNSKIGGGGGAGRGGGFGPGGSGAGNATGAGAASGAARPGGIGAAEAAAGRGMGGLGSGSAAGRGGMGAGGLGRGQKGEGDEDTEHSRPTYLVEGDPDEVFGTDLRTAPPVIGE
ncbi:hypothetical protein [Amycolatopsis australiensis]|uniref:PPE family protein n=1 Tax=Amycolatopsis australiensis TaxID=546364 RepID=A0A1K1PTC9_9PSEU|nr:hypothetical protein [Amycolatopsis australiensis]SFW50817.1 hypothetical protein SAMN04489730_0995 [Amycolatopsis australiensis]